MEIHKMVRAGYFPNCTTLAQVIEVTPKTIQRDVSFMREQLGMPLAYHELEHGFYYTREVHEFPLLQLTRHDVVALFLAKQALEPMRGTRLERMLCSLDHYTHTAAPTAATGGTTAASGLPAAACL